MLKGKLIATSDYNMVMQAMNGPYKVIYLGDPTSLQPDLLRVFTLASAWIPDYETMSMHVDGNTEGFLNLYLSSLASNASMQMFSVVFAALYKGVNIILFIPPEALDLKYGEYLLRFMEYNFGITAETASTVFMVNPDFYGKITELMYLDNLITPQECLYWSPSVGENTIRKLVYELKPLLKNNNDTNEIVEWLRKYKQSMLSDQSQYSYGIQYAGEEGYRC